MCDLQTEIAKFKAWVPPHEDRHGEWEFVYERWDTLLEAAISKMNQFADTAPPPDMMDALLYVLARDNESEHLRDHLIETPKLLSHLAVHARTSVEPDAKWQIVSAIAEAGLDNAAELIRPFLYDQNEYVRRRSLLALPSYAPLEAEEIARQNLTHSCEYTRSVALHVLYITGSTRLASSLDALQNDSNEVVRKKVSELRENIRSKR